MQDYCVGGCKTPHMQHCLEAVFLLSSCCLETLCRTTTALADVEASMQHTVLRLSCGCLVAAVLLS